MVAAAGLVVVDELVLAEGVEPHGFGNGSVFSVVPNFFEIFSYNLL